MDIYEFAIKMEQDGEVYFRSLAQETTDKGLANIFTMLADAEVKHVEVLREMQGGAAPSLSGSSLMADVKNVFVKNKYKK